MALKYILPCSMLGIDAMAPDYPTCLSFQFSYGVQYLKIEYLCFTVTATVILISLFGKINESYKWFILNQALWDLIVEYDYVCYKPLYTTNMKFNTTLVKPIITCPYYADRFADNYLLGISYAASHLINYLPLSMLFMLSFSRFLALFKQHFYERHDNWKKILAILIFSNLASSFVICFYTLFFYFTIAKCQEINCTGSTRIGFDCNDIEYKKCIDISISIYEIDFVFRYMHICFIAIWLLLSIIFTLSILAKIVLHLLSQSQMNTSRFLGSVKILCVLLFQCFTATIFLSLSAFYEFMYTALPLFLQHYNNQDSYSSFFYYPPWLTLLRQNFKSVNMLRILSDSLIALFVLTGYRQGLFKFLKFPLQFLPKGIKKKIWKKKNNNVSQDSLFVKRS